MISLSMVIHLEVAIIRLARNTMQVPHAAAGEVIGYTILNASEHAVLD
ncbi:hypothetical protein IIA79_02315 [bacterium]|nr:hypothetical protein [bacterium]